jgi:hypothetical protein
VSLVDDADGVTLDELLAQNLRAVLDARGMRYVDLSDEMRRRGVPWTSNTPAQVLGLHRQLSLLEVITLCAVFEMSLHDILDGKDLLEITLPAPGAHMKLHELHAALDGRLPTGYVTGIFPELDAATELDRRVADQLGVTLVRLIDASSSLFGSTVTQERDRRAGDLSAMSKRSAQARRGHATRAIVAELEQYLAEQRRVRRRRKER